jgi:bloom syndrome protein
MTNAYVVSASFNRPNLHFEVRRKTNSILSEIVKWINANHPYQSGVVYCLTKRDTENVAKYLTAAGVSSAHYHSAVTSAGKAQLQDSWMKGTVKVIVATIAFGMGIDKPDVRFVVHYSMPRSIESYY